MEKKLQKLQLLFTVPQSLLSSHWSQSLSLSAYCSCSCSSSRLYSTNLDLDLTSRVGGPRPSLAPADVDEDECALPSDTAEPLTGSAPFQLLLLARK